MDCELELGFVLRHPLLNATTTEAESAIGAFALLCDFTARDVRRPEMRSGFGPRKAKHFLSSLSETRLLPRRTPHPGGDTRCAKGGRAPVATAWTGPEPADWPGQRRCFAAGRRRPW
ncbi:fumarylacetoacetate hydrolase family protein [Umezawaea sp. Da 62-37]|uniref:fumarylacetoacetate hydrolase family protein n=1 Tax=Umezawaea sp. Da 62-37 TaxID=3075927 RepID=UPI0037DC8F4A